jgi:hypothetical protein
MSLENVLLRPIEYKVVETSFGVWKRFMSVDGKAYAEFTSHRRVMGLPLVHYTAGRCPETGRRKVARGIIAVGRISVGVVAIGQAAFGLVAIGQLALGLMLGLGQATTGALALGQTAAGVVVAGQITAGAVAVGQCAAGYYVLAQAGAGVHVLDAKHRDPAAVSFFHSLAGR